jgi:hypothetical protein
LWRGGAGGEEQDGAGRAAEEDVSNHQSRNFRPEAMALRRMP